MKKIILLAVAIAAMASCSKEPVTPEVQEDNVIRLSTNIGPQTRATLTGGEGQNVQFVSGKSIYVEAYQTGESTTYTAGNYTAGAAGALTGSLYYPANGTNVDICAFYPNTVSSATGSFAVGGTQTSASQYQSYDLMYATKLTDKAKGETHALTFHHALTKINVLLNPGSGVTTNDISTLVSAVTINNTKLTATTSITGGAITVSGTSGDAANITITGSDKSTQSGIIVPQTLNSGTTFITINYNSTPYTYSLTADTAFAAGYEYSYTFTLGTAGIQLVSSAITNWTSGTGDTANITL